MRRITCLKSIKWWNHWQREKKNDLRISLIDIEYKIRYSCENERTEKKHMRIIESIKTNHKIFYRSAEEMASEHHKIRSLKEMACSQKIFWT